MELINILLIILLGVVSTILIINIINRYNRNRGYNSINFIDNMINKNIAKCLKLREPFYNYSKDQKNAENNLRKATKNSKITTTTTKNPSKDYGSITKEDPCKYCNNTNNDESLNNMIKNLDNLEDKCKEYEDRHDTWDKEQKEKHEKVIKEQIELEDKKINELKEIVNFYRRKYNEKLHINTQCRQSTVEELKKTVDEVVKLDGETIKKQDKQIDINLSEFIKKNK